MVHPFHATSKSDKAAEEWESILKDNHLELADKIKEINKKAAIARSAKKSRDKLKANSKQNKSAEKASNGYKKR